MTTVYSKNGSEFDIDNIATDLNNKADIDLSNINPAQNTKNEIISWGIPDYSAGVSVISPYTAQANGYIMFDGSAYGAGNASYLDIDEKSACGINTAIANFIIPIAKGSVASIRNLGSGSGSIAFYPVKGAN